MEQIRSFVAIELADNEKKALNRMQSLLKSGGQFPVKWVDPFSVHLTLKFLGNINPDNIEQITGAMEEAARGIPPLLLEINGLGVFPNPRRVQVIWVGISGEVERLNQLQQCIESNISPLGFPTETRQFKPHLTLGRVRERATQEERESLGRYISAIKPAEVYNFKVDSVHLMRSQLTSEGAVYSRIGSVRLK
ncbi:RNA 2',3'-cyclic phosphodiesterase [Chloroflexota bacterium]